jgi:hypothetical protein
VSGGEGHTKGYYWAMQNGITDPAQCGGNSRSFIEGCQEYALEQIERAKMQGGPSYGITRTTPEEMM